MIFNYITKSRKTYGWCYINFETDKTLQHLQTEFVSIYVWLSVIKKCIQLNNRKLVNTVLYVDDQILMATSEDDLQTMAHQCG